MARSVVLALLAARASALVLRDATACWGTSTSTPSANFFDGIDVRLAPALADVDGDGDLDLVVGSWDGILFYFENVGSAASPSYEAVTGSANPFDGIDVGAWSKPAFADVDGDGDLDLVVGEHDGILFYYERRYGTLFYYENVGSAASPDYAPVTGAVSPFDGIDVGWSSKPALADVDGDGDLDLVLGEDYGTLFYYENVGSAASPSYEAVTGAANPFDGIYVGQYSAPALADLDSDGDLDLVVGEYYGSLYYYGEPYSGGVLNYFEIVGSATSPSYEAVTGAANPFDGIYVDYGVLFYYENVGNAESPSFEARTGTANPFDGIDVGSRSEPALADVDGDGDLDLVVGEKYGAFYYYENVGNAASPTYAARTGSASPFDGIDVGARSKPAFADVDGDGDLDLVVGEHDGILFYYENVGSATSPSYAARTGSANPFDGIDVSYYSAPAFADLDDDGDLDLVVGEHDGILFYYENVGNATSPSYEAVTGAANPFGGIDVGWFSAPALADLDGDGDLDLVVGQDDGVLNFFANGYCTQGGNACRGSGLCDLTNVIFSEASCQCLGGFDHEVPDVVMQCGECQAGFYGSTCEPCPQGGDEDRNAPRLTDTCGVAGSGRSRGSCDDGRGGTGTCACFGDVFSGSGCTEGTCPAGTVETATFDGYYNIANCTSCDAGTFSAEGDPQSDGASEQTACDAGKYSGSGADECVDCEAGTYQDATGQSSCALADAGSFVQADGASEQTACDAGKYSGSGASECDDCAAGTYQDATGQSSCALATAASSSSGRRVGADRVRCGQVQRLRRGRRTASEQTACDAGKYSGSGADECVDCEAGTYQDATGQSSCALADGGSFVKRTASEQTACERGQVQRLGASECDDCAAGTYQDATGQSSCALADGGSFVQADGASEQTACDAGKYSGSGADECIDCEAGTYQDATGQSSCKLADGGSFVDAMGASEQRECPAGSFSGSASGKCDDRAPARSSSECATCEVGTYSTEGSDTCTLCPSGYSSDAEGASECEACPVGKYKGAGSGPCLDCAAAKYADEEGSSDCKLAEAGSFVGSTGASASTACFAGTYSATASSACATCEVGTYSTEGDSSCTSCPAGFSSSAAGASECSACPVGTFKGAGSGPCVECGAGTFGPETGQSSCLLANSGFFVNDTGASEQTASSLALNGVDASAFNDDAVANAQLKAALEATLVADLFSFMVDSAGIASVGPAITNGSSAKIWFELEANYTAAAGEDLMSTEELVLEDFELDLLAKIEDGTLQRNIEEAVSSGRALGLAAVAFGSALGSATVDVEMSSEGVDAATVFTDSPPGGFSTGETSSCPPGTFSSSGASECVECERGSYTDDEGQNVCKLASAGEFVADAGATAQTPCAPGKISPGGGSFACDDCEPAAAVQGVLRRVRRRVGGETRANCPQGARTTLETMDLKKNFWRASIDATSIYECIFEESCKGGANSSCARGHKGPLCGACKAHYFYDTAANRCVDCGNKIKASGDNIIGTVLAVLFVVAPSAS
ncbi:hypothetical protein JL722_10451 [Aureococcus anophagefferens]|nr:hypothetical protein JL722_10451 [Aureococcus anophagefferens]